MDGKAEGQYYQKVRGRVAPVDAALFISIKMYTIIEKFICVKIQIPVFVYILI